MKRFLAVLFLCCGVSVPSLAQTKPSLAVLPVEGASAKDGEALAALFADLLSKQKLFAIVSLSASDLARAQGRTVYTDYLLESKLAPFGEQLLLLLSVRSPDTKEEFAGASRVFPSIEALLPEIPGIIRELVSLLPPVPDSLKKPEAGPGRRSLEQPAQPPFPPKKTIPGPLFIMPFFGANPEEEALYGFFAEEISREGRYTPILYTDARVQASLQENGLAPLTNIDNAAASKLGRILNTDYLFYGRISPHTYSRSLDVYLIHTKTLEILHAGPWAYTHWENLSSSPLWAQLNQNKTLPPWEFLLRPYRHTVGGRALVKLLASGINTQSGEGDTPLIRAASYGYKELAEILLLQGAHTGQSNRQGWTALHWAAARGDTGIARLLLDAKAPPNAQTADGWTPLITAAIKGNAELSAQLIQAGADLQTTDSSGRTALQWAEALRYTALADLLRRAGAR